MNGSAEFGGGDVGVGAGVGGSELLPLLELLLHEPDEPGSGEDQNYQ